MNIIHFFRFIYLFSSSSLKVLFLLSVILNFSGSAYASSSCSTFLEKLVNLFVGTSYQAPSVSLDLKKSLDGHFNKDSRPHISNVNFNSFGNAEYWLIFSKMPRLVIDHLKLAPNNISDFDLFRRSLKNAVKDPTGTELRNILDGMRSELIYSGKDNITMEKKIERGLEEFRELPIERIEQLEYKYQSSRLIKKANALWDKHFFRKIPYTVEGNKVRIEIDGILYEGKIVKKRGHDVIMISVPKEKFKHPAWNPLDHNHLAKLASEPFNRKKEFYPVQIGLDGKFYLLDGNHRFVFDQRAMLTAEISFPPTTSNLRIYFDLIGIPQPTSAQKIDILEGRLDPLTLIPEHIIREMNTSGLIAPN